MENEVKEEVAKEVNPNELLSEAMDFLNMISARMPNGGTWSGVKSTMDQIIDMLANEVRVLG